MELAAARIAGGDIVGQRMRSAARIPVAQRLVGESRTLRMRSPGVHRSERRRASSRVDDRAFEFIRVPGFHGGGDALLIRRNAEHARHSLPMVRIVSVQPDPAIGGFVVPGDGIPSRGKRPSDRLLQPLAAECRPSEPPVDADRAQRILASRGP